MTDAVPPRDAPSLANRLVMRLAYGGVGHDRRAGIAVALLLGAAPAAVWAGARWTEAGVRRDIAAIAVTAKPRLAALAARDAARTAFAPLISAPGAAATLDGLAAALPTDATLTRATRGRDGQLTIDVAAADPDRLRAALRRHTATQRLRDAGQRRGDGTMTVTLETTP